MKRWMIAFILNSLSLQAAAETNREVKIIFYSQAKIVKNQKVVLDDLGFVDGAKADESMSLGNTQIFPRIEFQGTTAVLPGSEVGRAFKINAQAPVGTELRLVLPEQIELQSTETILPQARVENQIRYQASRLCEDCRITIKDLKVPYSSATDVTADWDLDLNSLKRGGAVLLPLRSDASTKKYWVSAFVQLEKEGYVMKRGLPSGSALAPEDIEKRWIDITFAKDELATESEVRGQILQKFLTIHTAIYRTDLRKVFAIRKGQSLRVKSGYGALEVSRDVIADENGYVGDLIRLRVPDSKITLTGKVMGTLEARIE